MRKCLLMAFLALLWGVSYHSVALADATRVDINTATAAELDKLPGVGPAIAARIIDFRTKNGPFKRPEDIMNVRGIGEKKFLKMKDRIAVSTAPAPPKIARKPPARK